MKSVKNSFLSTFIENFEKEIDLKEKIHASEHNQLAKIAESLQYNLLEFLIEIKPAKVVGGNHPVAYFNFKEKFSEGTMIELLCEYFKSSSIAYRKHKFNGSYPIFSIKNNTIPDLVEGIGYSMISLVSRRSDHRIGLKLESLRENQIIRTLDCKFENLTLVVWNGKSMTRSTFTSDPVNLEEKVPTEDGYFNLELISDSIKSPLKIKGDFSLSINKVLILERITEIARG
jgi:hypothetical protein